MQTVSRFRSVINIPMAPHYLPSETFDQIKLILIGKSGSAQVDILFLTETFLKPDIPDVLYAVPGFSIYRHDRVSRCGGGVLVFVNDQLKLKRRDDLENLDLVVIWLEVEQIFIYFWNLSSTLVFFSR